MVEIVSPGNKHSWAEFREFVEKWADTDPTGGTHAGDRSISADAAHPSGMAKAIWDQFEVEAIMLPPGKPLTISSYDAGFARAMYVSFAGVGDVLPDVPLFLRPDVYVYAPLESSYQEAWHTFPAPLKALLERGPGEPH